MAHQINILEKKSLWLPLDLWNLNELFTTESISPISFYRQRNFGNSVNHKQGLLEDTNSLVLFDEAIQNPILLKVTNDLLDANFLTEIKATKKTNFRSYKYSKTIYLQMDISIYFSIH